MAKKNATADKQKITKNYIDLLYMTPSTITAKDIADFLKDSEGIIIELWEAMNVLEIELSNGSSIDFEPLQTTFKDPSDAAYIKNRNIKTIFALQLCEDDFQIVTPYLESLAAQFSGFVCADSENFQPIYIGKA